ncbi:MAG: three-Cys-motif partner protein TcmP [Limnothrix sp. CACIAM 69d]|nr:MAG: three-Cys-motif partner protein TcmP [Limnothrix sp. CACIAM 69d]
MSQSEWSSDGKSLPIIEPHTKAKHKILEEYVENLILTLYKKGRYGLKTFTFIDGFCGGGMYHDPSTNELWEGSPLRIMKAVERGCQKSRRKYPQPLDVKYIFIDSKTSHLECLKNFSMHQAGFSEEFIRENCQFEKGEFENVINSVLLNLGLRKGHSLFFLDPFGWSHVSMSTIRKINSLSKSEIIYTYMIDPIARFIEQRNDAQLSNFQNILEADGYYLQAKPSMIKSPEYQCYLRNETMRLFRDKGRFNYIFTFSLISRGFTRVIYYLIHMSNNLTALEVMKESFWKENTLDYEYYFELYGYGFRSIDFYQENQIDLKFDINQGNESFCISKLDNEVGALVEGSQDGISFQEISEQTMQTNPASRKHYLEYLKQRREAGDFEIIRDGKITNSRDLKRTDIVRIQRNKQLFLFRF